MKTFDRLNLKTLRKDIKESLKEISKKHNIDLKTGTISFTPQNLTMKIKGSVISNGEIFSQERIDFKHYANVYDLNPDDLDKTFLYRMKEYKITGLKFSSKKYPILAVDLSTNRQYGFPSEIVKIGLNKKDI